MLVSSRVEMRCSNRIVARMRIEMSDERDSSWEQHRSRFRVYFFKEPGPGYSIVTFDITGATFAEAMRWAEDEASDRMYSIALVSDNVQNGRGLVWLIGHDANDNLNPYSEDEDDETEIRLRREMEESLSRRRQGGPSRLK